MVIAVLVSYLSDMYRDRYTTPHVVTKELVRSQRSASVVYDYATEACQRETGEGKGVIQWTPQQEIHFENHGSMRVAVELLGVRV